MTPEGRVKRKVSALLKTYEPKLSYYMPVQNGMGKPSLDYIGCVGGRYFAVETKAEGKQPTARQWQTIKELREAGATVFVICGEESPLFKGLELFIQANI